MLTRSARAHLVQPSPPCESVADVGEMQGAELALLDASAADRSGCDGSSDDWMN